MSLYLSASTAAGAQTVPQSNDLRHALRRDKDGMLRYTVARSTDDVSFCIFIIQMVENIMIFYRK